MRRRNNDRNWISEFCWRIGLAGQAIARDLGGADAAGKAWRSCRKAWRSCGRWLADHYVQLLLAFALLLVIPWFLLVLKFVVQVFDLLMTSEADPDKRRSLAYAVGVNMTALAALIAAPLVLIRVWVNERQAEAIARQTTTVEQGHITDRLNKAIEMLGAEKTVSYRARYVRYGLGSERDGYYVKFGETSDQLEQVPQEILREHERRMAQDEVYRSQPAARHLVHRGSWADVTETMPNLEVRLGAIHSLKRIAEDSERDHITVMQTLCAYIRENAPASDAKRHKLGDFPRAPDSMNPPEWSDWHKSTENRVKRLEDWVNELTVPRVDIQAAVTVIGRRSAARRALERAQKHADDDKYGYRLDLRDTNLQKSDLRALSLDDALFDGARLEGADLNGVHLERAWLFEAHLEMARLEGAFLESVELDGANLERTRLNRANLRSSKLNKAHLEFAVLSEAHLQSASLDEAFLERATLIGAKLQGAWLTGAHLKRARLNGARLEGAHLNNAHVERASLMDAHLEGAHVLGWSIAGASLRSAELGETVDLAQDHVNSAFGDGTTLLPVDFHPPKHWPMGDPGVNSYNRDYRKWLTEGALPGGPFGTGN